jgi:hypothetical protein
MVEICGHRERWEERSREGGSPPELNHPGIGAAGIEGAPGTEGTDGAPGAEGIDDAPATDGTPIGEAVAVGDDIMEEHIFCIIWPAAFWPACFAAPSAAEPIPPAAPCACVGRTMHAKMSATVSPEKVCTFMINAPLSL